VGYRKHFNYVVAQPVDQAEGETGKDVASSASAVAGPSLRRLGHRFNGMSQFLPKAVRRC
jgi:hypothetical protein